MVVSYFFVHLTFFFELMCRDVGCDISRKWKTVSHGFGKCYITDMEKNASHEYGKLLSGVAGARASHGFGKEVEVSKKSVFSGEKRQMHLTDMERH